jgi:5-methylcytosine-specific restriction endonuclease McrA
MIRGAIRRTFSRSPIVREVLMSGRREIPKYNKDGSRAKKDAVQYQCQVCLTWTGSTKVVVDHVEPVISVEDGFKDWNTFVDRLFCDKGNLQRICDPCHDKKTGEERFERMYKKDQEELRKLETSTVTNEDFKKFLKKFTKKKLANYPQDWQDRIKHSKLKHGMKV